MGNDIDFGYMVEGVVELDPLTGRYIIKTFDDKHRLISVDVQNALASYKGKEVRFILTTFDTIQKIAKLVEEGKELVEVSHPNSKKPS